MRELDSDWRLVDKIYVGITPLELYTNADSSMLMFKIDSIFNKAHCIGKYFLAFYLQDVKTWYCAVTSPTSPYEKAFRIYTYKLNH